MRKKDTDLLVEGVVKGMLEKKAFDVVMLDFEGVDHAVCDRFIICHGTSKVHVEAIAESVLEEARKLAEVKPSRNEGLSNAEWVLLDYFDVVVHIFQENTRQFYALEKLWGDATIKKFDS